MQKEQEKGNIIVVYGGSGSGKSQVAENISEKFYQEGKKEHLYYIATMMPFGEESQKKIERHKRQRQEKQFVVKEIYYDLDQKQKEFQYSVLLLDCLSNLVANEWYRFISSVKNSVEDENKKKQRELSKKIVDTLREIRGQKCDIIVVTNDIFRSVRTHWDGEEDYLSCLGLVNEQLVEQADAVYQVVAGKMLCLKKQEKTNGDISEGLAMSSDSRALSLLTSESNFSGKYNKDREKQEKILVVGGEFQGKKDWVKKNWLVRNEINIGNSKEKFHTHNREENCGYHLYFYVDQWILLKIEENPFLLSDATTIEEKLNILWGLFEWDRKIEGNSIYLMNEVGCGIVPVEKKDRIYRELSGRFMCQLADKVEQVYQIVAGYEIRLK